MRKYQSGQAAVGAIYDSGPTDNPFLSAMPEMLSRVDFLAAVRGNPPLPHNLAQLTSEERRQALPLIASFFAPLDYMYTIYDQLYRAIRTTYSTRTVLDSIRQTNALFCKAETKDYATQADTGSILGVPGVGKTSTIRRCLATLPQVVGHERYRGEPFYCKQVLYLQVECPSDCSVKTLAFNILASLDRAIGSNYLGTLTSLRSASTSAVATQIKILCLTHHVGLILVDEIQNAVVTAQRNHQIKPLVKFLVELTNDTCTAVYFVGTPLAEELFASEEHLKRRTRGLRLLPLKPGGAFHGFVRELWPYQLTLMTAPLTDKLTNKLYDWSGGIPAYIVKIFVETQVQALLQGSTTIDEQVMQRAINMLAIKIPKTHAGGTCISDFEVVDGGEEVVVAGADLSNGVALADNLPVTPRMYANKRGRKVVARDELDLIVAYKSGCDMVAWLRGMGMMGDWKC